MTLTVDDYDLRFRLPDSDDLLAIANENEIKPASQALLQRCLIDAKRNGTEKSASELPEKIIIADTMERADAQAIWSALPSMSSRLARGVRPRVDFMERVECVGGSDLVAGPRACVGVRMERGRDSRVNSKPPTNSPLR